MKVVLWRPAIDTIPRLKRLLGDIRSIRSNCYPKGWNADPLYKVEQELDNIIENAIYGCKDCR